MDGGTIRATFVLVSKNMVKGMQDIKKEVKETGKAIEGTQKISDKSNKTMTEAQKISDKLRKSTTLEAKELKKMLDQTKLTNTEKMKFIDTVGRLEKGVRAGTHSVNAYHKDLGILSKQYGLTYKQGRIFDAEVEKQSKSLAKQKKAFSESNKLLTEHFKKYQITTPEKVIGNETQAIRNFNAEMAKANKLLMANRMSMGQYKTFRSQVAKTEGLNIKNNGYAYDSRALADLNQKMQNYIKTHDAYIEAKKRGLPITERHNALLRQYSLSEKEVSTARKANVISQQMYNNLNSRMNGTYEKLNVSTSNLNRSYGTLANATNTVSRSQRMQNYAMQVAAMRYNAVGLAVSALGGMVVGVFVQDFMMARSQSIRLDQQMQQFFSTMKLGKGAFNDFNKALDEFIAKNPKINKYTLGSTIAQIGKLNNLNLSQMKKSIPVIADISNMMQLNGRTAEDTMLAINDAFDGQFKRLQEIGVQGKKQLMEQYGYDGKTADSLIASLEKMDKAKGWSDLTNNISTASDAFQVLGNAIDRIIVPAINLLTPAIVAVSTTVADLLSYLNNAPPIVQALATGLMIAGGAFGFMKLQMVWAKAVGSEMMAGLTGLDQGMQRVTTTMYSARDVAQMLPQEFEGTARSMAELEYNNKKTAIAWNDLNSEVRNSYVQNQRASLAYQTLDRNQKAQVNTLMRTKGLTREQAVLQALDNKALEEGIVLSKANNTTKNQGIFASMKQAYATTLKTGATEAESVATGKNTLMTSINTQAKNVGTMASTRLAQAQLFLTSTTGLLVIGFVALVAVLGLVAYSMTAGARKATQAMSEYNDFLENGEEKVQKLKDASSAYNTEAKDLEATRDRLKKAGKDTTEIEKQIADCYAKSRDRAKEAKDAEYALKKGREQKTIMDAQHLTSQYNYNQQTLDLMKQRGLITQKQYEDQKNYNAIVLAGGEQVQKGLQAENLARTRGINKLNNIFSGKDSSSKAYLADAKEGGQAIQDMVKAHDELAKVAYEEQTATSMTTKVWLQLVGAVIIVKMAWIDFTMWVKSGVMWIVGGLNSLQAGYDGLCKTINDGLTGAWNGFVGWFMNGYNQIKGFLSNIGSNFSLDNWLKNAKPSEWISNWLNDNIVKPISDWWNSWSLANLFDFSRFGITMPTFDFVGWFNNTITIPIQNGWNGLILYLNGVWTGIVQYAQMIWSLIYNAIVGQLNRSYAGLIVIANGIKRFIGGAWNYVVSITVGTWSSVHSKITSTMSSIWNKVTSVVSSVKNAFNSMKSSLIGSASSIFNSVWKSYLEPLWNNLKKVANWIMHPFSGGSGGVAGGLRAGSPTLGAGSPKIGAGSKGLSRGRQTSSGNNLFSGLGNAIKSTFTAGILDTGLPNDPRFGAGDPRLASGKLVTNPYECDDPKKCYAGGWDFSSTWISGIKKEIAKWTVSIGGVATNIFDFANGQGSTALFDVIARRIIGGTRYQFYYGDGKSNAQALKDKSFNCYDGAQILIDLAHGLGLSASMSHGTWNGTPHVWATVNGKPFDTTAYQHGYGWTAPAVRGYAGGSTTPTPTPTKLEVNIRLDGDVHGIEDYERRMTAVAKEVFYKIFGGTNPLIG